MARRYTPRQTTTPFPWEILVFILFLTLLGGFLLQNFALDLFTIGLIVGFLLLVAVLLGIFLIWYTKMQDDRRQHAITISEVDSMGGFVFEKYVGELLKHQGYKVQFTKDSGDFGTDIVASQGASRFSVQIKRYNHTVNRNAISDAVGAMASYGCNRSMVVTNNYFTPQAQEFAQTTGTVLIDREKLIDWILDYQPGNPGPPPQIKLTSSDYAYKLTQKLETHSKS